MKTRYLLYFFICTIILTSCGGKDDANLYGIMYQNGVYASKEIKEINEIEWAFLLDKQASEPLITNKNAYIGTYEEFYKINLKNGALEWTVPIKGVPSVPAVVGSLVCLSDKRALKCLDDKTGRVQWEREYQGSVSTDLPLAPIKADSNNVLFSDEGILASLDIKSGEDKWIKQYEHAMAGITPWMIHNKVFEQSDNNIELINFESGELEERFPIAEALFDVNSNDDTIVISGLNINDEMKKNIIYIDRATKKILWTYTSNNLERLDLPPRIKLLDQVILATNQWTGELFTLDRKTGKVLWQIQVGSLSDERFISDSSIAGSNIYIAHGERIVCLDLKTGNELWEYQHDTRFQSAPAIMNGRIYILDEANRLIALKSGKK